MPKTMCQATTSLLPEPSEDHSQLTNFRPISINININMETAISSLIHLDQVGFIKG